MKALLLSMVLTAAGDASAQDATSVRRIALLVGVNDGGPERGKLRYAGTDAEAFGRVLEELGGVSAEDRVSVLESDRAGVERGLERLAMRAAAARRPGVRVEVVVYYSGHSDENGLLLRGERYGFRDLRASLDKIPADVRIAVLDSCASGAMARAKGGVFKPAFLVDASAQVRGHAILTSSSATEVSQESDRLRGSFFTHHLVSGMRGAADVNRDGRVTLTEAYQFAFHETLARTENTRGGAQHPNYDIDLAGTGDLVMTDLRVSTAGLVLEEPLEGRIFVRDAAGHLVVEVNKRPGAAVDLGLPAGRYSIRRELGQGSSLADITLREGGRASLGDGDFVQTKQEQTAMRGDAPPLRKVPLNLSLFPAFSTNDVIPEPVENNVALGIATRSAAIDGVALGVVGTWVDQDVRWFQGSIVGNVAGGRVRGGQFAIGLNLIGASLVGVQVGGFYNGANGDVTGVQFAGGGNVARGAVRGAQLGQVNWMETTSRGGQLGAINIARSQLRGVQVGGLINWAGSVSGAQFGLINTASRVHGLQLGLVNVSDDVEGASIGLVNVVKNGMLHAELFASDLAPINVAFKSGSRRAYSTLVIGGGRAGTLSYGAGFGARLIPGTFMVDLDLLVGTVVPWNAPVSFSNITGQLRLLAGYQLHPRFTFFAGPTANLLGRLAPTAPDHVSYVPAVFQNSRRTLSLWPGFQAGVRF